jgi:hypothetical protein
MHWMDTLAAAFFNIFGITQPSDGARRRATWFLLGMLMLVALAVATGGWLLYHLMHIG